MTIERTIADLVEDRKDLSLVADATRDGSGERILDLDRLRQLLVPLAERNRFGKGDSRALLDRLMEIAGIDIEPLAQRVAADPSLGAHVAAGLVGRLTKTDINELARHGRLRRAGEGLRDRGSGPQTVRAARQQGRDENVEPYPAAAGVEAAIKDAARKARTADPALNVSERVRLE